MLVSGYQCLKIHCYTIEQNQEKIDPKLVIKYYREKDIVSSL